jgi:hypothetical protein
MVDLTKGLSYLSKVGVVLGSKPSILSLILWGTHTKKMWKTHGKISPFGNQSTNMVGKYTISY